MPGSNNLWKPQFRLDIEVVDEQHKKFFVLCNNIRDLSRGLQGGVCAGDVVRAVVAMRSYAFKHFHTEETLMAAYDFPGLYAHSRRHDAYLSDLMAFGAELEAYAKELGKEPHRAFLDLTRRIYDYTVSWWSEHIMTVDMVYARHVRERRRAET